MTLLVNNLTCNNTTDTNTDLDVDGSSPALCHKIIDSQSAIDLQNEVASYFEVCFNCTCTYVTT